MIIDKKMYKKKVPSEFSTFAEKIICARLNFSKGKSKKDKRGTGLTLNEAGKKIGITGMFLSLLERGVQTRPDAITVHNIENIYGFQPGELSALLAQEHKDKEKVG